jgi:hypothetical protein
VRRIWVLTVVTFVVVLAIDLLLGASLPAVTGLYAFIGCIVIIVASKQLGKRLLQRDEDHYGPQPSQRYGAAEALTARHGLSPERAELVSEPAMDAHRHRAGSGPEDGSDLTDEVPDG